MPTKITYNGKTTEVSAGDIATIACKDYKMATDVVVEAPESEGESAKLYGIEVTPTKAIQNVLPEGDYDGFDEVIVNPIPDEYKIVEEYNGEITMGVNAVGDWVFNRTLTEYPSLGWHPFGSGVKYNLTDGSVMNVSYWGSTSGTVNHVDQIEYGGYGVYFYKTGNDDRAGTVSKTGWVEQVYRRITIESNPTNETFLEWFTGNAVKTVKNPSNIIGSWFFNPILSPTLDGEPITLDSGEYYVLLANDDRIDNKFFDIIKVENTDSGVKLSFCVDKDFDMWVDAYENGEWKHYMHRVSFGPNCVSANGYSTFFNWLKSNAVKLDNLSTFSVDGKLYYFEDGMSWSKWRASAYNANEEYSVAEGDKVVNQEGDKQLMYGSTAVDDKDKIIKGADYTLQAIEG